MSSPLRRLRARLQALELGWRVVGRLISLLARLAFRIEVVGGEHLPRRGAALVVANHVSHSDPVVLAMVLYRLGRHPRFVGLADLWHVPVTGRLARLARAIPVRRGGGVEQLSDPVCRALEEGRVVVVYPQGTIAPPGEVREGPPGIGDVALRTSAPILPVALWGMQRGSGLWPPLLRRVAVVVGEPVEPGGHGHADPRSRRVAAATALLDAIAALVPRAQAVASGEDA